MTMGGYDGFTKTIPILELLERYIKAFGGQEAWDAWYENWVSLAHKDPTSAMAKIEAFKKEFGRSPSYREICFILDIDIDIKLRRDYG